MTVKLKKLLGDGGAGIDESHGSDRLYQVLEAVVNTQNALVTNFNALRADYAAETNADHTVTGTSAVAVTAGVEVE